jgi:hypothetical protein
MTEQIEGDFNWVSERAACSLAIIFGTLKLQVREDVKTRTDLRPDQPHYGFKFADHAPDAFIVGLDAEPAHYSILFKLESKKIEISGDGIKTFEATPTVNDEGKCLLKVNGVEREFWQVRRMALEKLFFETV